MTAETTLREALEAEAGALDVRPDPWPGFTRREQRHRRTRRLRVAVAAAALAAAAGVQSGVLPLPGWAPGIAVAGRETALVKSPIRGSLAGDTAWLTGLRGEIKDVEDPGERWQVADRSRIRFLYAGDVGGRRLALAMVPLRFGFLTDQMLMWYEGAAGAAPAEMEESGRSDGGEIVLPYLQGSSGEPGVLVVVAPAGSTVAVSRGFRYAADGRVVHETPVVAQPGTGLAEMIVPPAPFDPGTTLTVTSGGRTLYNGPAYGGWSGRTTDGDPHEPTDAMVTAELGDRGFDRLTLSRWIGNALRDARLPAAGTAVALRWIGTVEGQPAALITLRPAGGGVLAYATHGRADSYRQDLRLLLPAAGVAERPIAWRMRAEGRDDRTDRVVVVAPAGAARLSLQPAGAPPVPLVPDATGAATVGLPPSAEATVTAYAADGSVLGTTPVPPFETDSGGLPGDTPKTRIVE